MVHGKRQAYLQDQLGFVTTILASSLEASSLANDCNGQFIICVHTCCHCSQKFGMQLYLCFCRHNYALPFYGTKAPSFSLL